MKRFWSLAWLLIPLSLSPLQYAHAYLDPGSGSYMIQVIIGVLFGVAYTLKSVIAKIVHKVRERFRKRE